MAAPADSTLRPAAPPRRSPRILLGSATLLLRRHPFAVAGIAIYLVFLLVAASADHLAPFDPTEILFRANGKLAANLKPGAPYWLGTTNLGRDIFSQLVWGTRSALAVGTTAALAVVAI